MKPKYNIGDRVYYVTPESDIGIVVDVRYSYLTKIHEYNVSFGHSIDTLWYYEHELSENKMFNINNN